MRVLILGANGFIGSAVTLGMIQHGHQVFAVARDIAAGQRRLWEAEWIKVDLARLLTPKDWRPLLRGVDAVVNCAGALQDSARDNVEALQLRAMQALYAAAPRAMLVVQVSARTDGAARDTAFLASKHAADEALKASGLSHVILRPAVVIGRGAYGGSALLRGLAAMPFVTPVLAPKSAIQFAAIDDVVAAVADALGGKLPDRTDIEIAGPRKWTLAEAVARHRQWLGLAPAKTIPVPRWIGRIVAAGADQLA
ncbi:NAD(P)H-binding protein, partial [Escherichia coli]|nr:NAD(P)H-binding protein [Escherichia coli]